MANVTLKMKMAEKRKVMWGWQWLRRAYAYSVMYSTGLPVLPIQLLPIPIQYGMCNVHTESKYGHKLNLCPSYPLLCCHRRQMS